MSNFRSESQIFASTPDQRRDDRQHRERSDQEKTNSRKFDSMGGNGASDAESYAQTLSTQSTTKRYPKKKKKRRANSGRLVAENVKIIEPN